MYLSGAIQIVQLIYRKFRGLRLKPQPNWKSSLGMMVIPGVILTLIGLVVLSACSSPSPSTPSGQSPTIIPSQSVTPTVTISNPPPTTPSTITSPIATSPIPTPTPTPTPSPSLTPTPTPSITPTNVKPTISGEDLYQRTAGGMGCAACHGADARGGLGPNIRNASAQQIKNALQNVAAMKSIKLTDEEINAIAGYLQSLGSP